MKHILTILDSDGLDAALEAMDNDPALTWQCRLFCAWAAERVLPIWEAEYPGDLRPRQAIEAARDPNVTDEQLRAALVAAGDARAAAWAARAAGDAEAAAWAAAWDAEVAEREAQEAALRRLIETGRPE
jgi:hypothetical protein